MFSKLARVVGAGLIAATSLGMPRSAVHMSALSPPTHTTNTVSITPATQTVTSGAPIAVTITWCGYPVFRRTTLTSTAAASRSMASMSPVISICNSIRRPADSSAPSVTKCCTRPPGPQRTLHRHEHRERHRHLYVDAYLFRERHLRVFGQYRLTRTRRQHQCRGDRVVYREWHRRRYGGGAAPRHERREQRA